MLRDDQRDEMRFDFFSFDFNIYSLNDVGRIPIAIFKNEIRKGE